jgi:predicted HicB family RNase H-like nuclease
MRYKNYEGVITHIDDQADLITGEVNGIQDGIMFQGRTASELKKAFEESIDDYLAWAAKDGFEPEKPFSGRFNLRVGPELHRQLALQARRAGKSLNEFIKENLETSLAG